MSEEKLGELKIKVPQNWIDALTEIHEKLGWDFEAECRGWLMPGMQTNMSELKAEILDHILQKYEAQDILEYEGVPSGEVKPENVKRLKMVKIVVFGVDNMRDIDFGNLLAELSIGVRKVFPTVQCDIEGWGLTRYTLLRAVAAEISQLARQDEPMRSIEVQSEYAYKEGLLKAQ